nr:reverse transcriptase domain-containing protein [Tanacetum cinerariifolium]
CPHHGFSELHQLDTFYNALNVNDQDSLNSAAGGNFLDKIPADCLKIIESKSKVRQTRAKAVVAKVNSNSSTPAVSSDIAELKDMVRALLLDKKNQYLAQTPSPTPAPIKSVEPNCVTCGGTHAYQNCPATCGNVYQDNIHEYVSQATSANYGQGNTGFRPQMVANQIRPPKFPSVQNTQNSFNRGNNFNQNRGGNFNQSNFNQSQLNRPQVNQPLAYQAPAYQAPVSQTQSVSQNDFERYIKANDAILRNIQNQGQRSGTLPVSEPVVAPVSAPMPNLKPSILYPLRRDTERHRDQANEQIEKFYKILKEMSFEISFTDALMLMPKFASTLKALTGNKEKLSEMARTPMNEHCSTVILNKLPKKLGDPGKFLIPCEFPGMDECLALADLGLSINLMPLSVCKGLSLLELTPTCMTLELVDQTKSKPVGIAKDVKVKVGVFHFPADFVVVDFKPDPRVPLILVRCFLKTSRALIDVHKGELTLRIGHEAITYNLDQTSRYSANYDQMKANKIDVTDEACEEYSDFLLFEKADAFLDLEDDPDSSELDPSYYDPEGDILLLEAILNSNPSPPLPNHEQSVPSFKEELKACEAKTIKSSIGEPPKVELKDLPPHLEYAFLEGDNKFPVIIAKELRDEEKSALKKVLKSHKRAIAWKLSDIQDFFKISRPMTHLLEKDTPFIFSEDCIQAFQTLKKKLTKAPILIALNWDLPFELMCDASDYDIGAILGKRHEKHFQPIHYASKTLTDAESNYTTTKKEMLAVVYAFENFRSYLIMNKCIVHTDHSALKYIFAKKDANVRLLRWVMLLQEFDFTVIDTKGAENLVADHLSRLENPYANVLDPKEINEIFPLETLSMVPRGLQTLQITTRKWVKAKALPTNDAHVVCKFLKSLFARFGAPRAIISDRGTHFCNDQFEKVMRKYGVTYCLSTAYHPQTSGQVEVTNRGLKRILERTIGQNRASWSDKLDDALWAFRTSYKTPIRCTLYKLVYGKACHLSIKLEHKAYWTLKQTNFDLSVAGNHRKIQLNELNELRDHAYENSLIYKEKTKRIHDSKIKNRVFNVGDQVLLFNSRLKIFSGKLKTRWNGPFTIAKVFPYGTVELSQANRPNFKVNGHRIKHYFGGDVPQLVVPDLQTFPLDQS